MSKKRVLIGMSGGVDSSYAAAFLKQEGYDVVGAMLNLWTEPSQMGENRCCSLDSQYLARRVAAQLDIPFYIIDAKEKFRKEIVEQFIADYINGVTPNPCIACNSKVRWNILLEQARKLGIEYIATGHYARICSLENGGFQLFKGLDANKDQSYVLSMLPREYLSQTILPLGDMNKVQVRERSRTLNLPSSNQPDSQDLCFLGSMDYREFLMKYAGERILPGDIVDESGKIVGRHEGLPFYTVGQRKGLRIANNKPYFVIFKNLKSNNLIVRCSINENTSSFSAIKMNWLVNQNVGGILECNVKIRYRSTEIPGIVRVTSSESVDVELDISKKPDITPGQIAVFYQKELCMGGGIIV
jgi:tRNA-uridine 2-sulfurtransferase